MKKENQRKITLILTVAAFAFFGILKFTDPQAEVSAQTTSISPTPTSVVAEFNQAAALAKLKRAYDAQRSKPFLVVSNEQDTNRAHKQLDLARTGPFHEIGRVTTILSFAQLRKLHRALNSVEDILAEIFE